MLLGPPGAGKSPFSQYLSQQVIGNSHFLSFDFGQELRHILSSWSAGKGQSQSEACYEQQDIERIRQSVEKAVLFEQADRELARRILKNFLINNKPASRDFLILNGLPRHEGQLAWLAGLARIVLVVNLDCPESISIKRIMANVDGERTGRSDDRPDIISQRCRIYAERTKPLIDVLMKQEIPVIDLPVNEAIRPEDLWEKLRSNETFNCFF